MISDDITMCCTILALFLAAVFGYKRFACGKKKACIVVLGDIGRSPRMQNHALSLVKHRFNVYFIGYRGMYKVSHCGIALLWCKFAKDTSETVHENTATLRCSSAMVLSLLTATLLFSGSRPHEDILMEERISLNYLIQVPGILQGAFSLPWHQIEKKKSSDFVLRLSFKNAVQHTLYWSGTKTDAQNFLGRTVYAGPPPNV